jgi:hypothetical protein
MLRGIEERPLQWRLNRFSRIFRIASTSIRLNPAAQCLQFAAIEHAEGIERDVGTRNLPSKLPQASERYNNNQISSKH